MRRSEVASLDSPVLRARASALLARPIELFGAILAFPDDGAFLAALETELNLRFAKILNVALLSCVAALGLSRTADAAYVVVKADPAFGPEFPSLGWRATGALYIPDACKDGVIALGYSYPVNLAWAGGLASIFSGTPFGDVAGQCAMSRMDDVELEFYDLSTGGTVETIDIGTYTPNDDFLQPPNALEQELIDFTIDEGKLVRFHTTLSIPVLATHPLAGGGENYFALEFSKPGARLVAFDGADWPFQYRDRIAVSSQRATFRIGEFLTDAEYAQLRAIPEPASLALALTALAAAVGIGHTGRRRSRRA